MRLGVNPSALLESLHLEALGVCASLRDSHVTIGGCYHLDGLEQRESSSGGWWLSLALVVVIVRGSWPFLGGEPKGTLVNCLWLAWSSSCVGCATPYWGFGVWYQLAREPLSEWIATTGTSLPASKWNLKEKSLCHHCLLGILWYSLIDHLPRRYISSITLLYYIVFLPCVELVVVVASCVA